MVFFIHGVQTSGPSDHQGDPMCEQFGWIISWATESSYLSKEKRKKEEEGGWLLIVEKDRYLFTNFSSYDSQCWVMTHYFCCANCAFLSGIRSEMDWGIWV